MIRRNFTFKSFIVFILLFFNNIFLLNSKEYDTPYFDIEITTTTLKRIKDAGLSSDEAANALKKSDKLVWEEKNLIWEAKSKLLEDIKKNRKREEQLYNSEEKDTGYLQEIWSERKAIHENEYIIRDKSLKLAQESGDKNLYKQEQEFWEALFLEWEKNSALAAKKEITPEDIDFAHNRKKNLWEREDDIWNREMLSIQREKTTWDTKIKKQYGGKYLKTEKKSFKKIAKKDSDVFIQKHILKVSDVPDKLQIFKKIAKKEEKQPARKIKELPTKKKKRTKPGKKLVKKQERKTASKPADKPVSSPGIKPAVKLDSKPAIEPATKLNIDKDAKKTPEKAAEIEPQVKKSTLEEKRTKRVSRTRKRDKADKTERLLNDPVRIIPETAKSIDNTFEQPVLESTAETAKTPKEKKKPGRKLIRKKLRKISGLEETKILIPSSKPRKTIIEDDIENDVEAKGVPLPDKKVENADKDEERRKAPPQKSKKQEFQGQDKAR